LACQAFGLNRGHKRTNRIEFTALTGSPFKVTHYPGEGCL
jgi:hypothetical protein